jgi:hypothetical protein
MQKMLLYLINKYFSYKLFNKKKNLIVTINNIFSAFIFSQYIYNNKDIFIPSIHNITNFKKTIKYYIKDTKYSLNFDNFINDFINYYEKEYNYFTTKKYNITNNYTITTKIIKNKDNNINIYFKTNIKIYNNYLNRVLNTIFISYDKYIALKKRYIIINNTTENFDKYIYILLVRYKILFSNNNQLAILPDIINKLSKDFNLNFETFGSFLNVNSNNFCSLYFDIERYFGSFGNFFSTTFIKGFYLFNPPFQEDIIIIGINRILKQLESKEKLGFFISIPIWDIEGKKKYDNSNDYNDFIIISKIKASKYLKLALDYSKENFSYIDHFRNVKKNYTIQNTYIFVLANYNDNFSKIGSYNFF